MKRITSKLFAALAVLCVFALTACGGAQAADFVANAPGTVVYGAGTLLSVEKNSDSGNRVAARYSSGIQYVADDGAWSKYGALVAAMGAKAVAVPGSATGKVVNISASNGVYCQNSNSVVAWPNVNVPDTIADGCQTWQAAKAAAN